MEVLKKCFLLNKKYSLTRKILSMNDKITIREYTLHDKKAVLNILRLNTPQYFSPEEEKDLIHYLDSEIDHYFVLELDNQIVGSGGINFPEDKTIGLISWGIIHPDYQKKSLGTALLKHRIEKLKEFNTIEQIVVRTSQVVYKFYEKSGFEIIEIVKDYWAKGFDLYKMKYAK